MYFLFLYSVAQIIVFSRKDLVTLTTSDFSMNHWAQWVPVCSQLQNATLTLGVKFNNPGNLSCLNHRHLIHFIHFTLFFSVDAFLNTSLQIFYKNGAKLVLTKDKFVLWRRKHAKLSKHEAEHQQ